VVGERDGRSWLKGRKSESELKTSPTDSRPGEGKAATLPPHNIAVAGCGRLRRPPTQPASDRVGNRTQVAWLREQQYSNRQVGAVSATAGTLGDIAGDLRVL
jgi:hypothetical protein